jgi:hypothetical protein
VKIKVNSSKRTGARIKMTAENKHDSQTLLNLLKRMAGEKPLPDPDKKK